MINTNSGILKINKDQFIPLVFIQCSAEEMLLRGYVPAVYCLNIFLIGVFFCLLMKWEGNFWVTCGVHTGWNYTQSFIMGASAVKYQGIIKGTANYNQTFFSHTYGLQGSLSTTVLVTVLILLLIYNLHKKGKLETD